MINTYKIERMQRISVFVEELSAALYSTCQIPEGCSLIKILGDGIEIDNRSALESWVHQQLATPSRQMSVAIMNQLVTDLDGVMRKEESLLWY